MSVVQVDHIKYQADSAPCCPVLVPRNDSVVPAGIPESMPGGDLPTLHSETLQQDGSQGNLPLRSAIGMVFVLESIFDFHERCWALHSLGGGSNVGEGFKETTGYGAFLVSLQAL